MFYFYTARRSARRACQTRRNRSRRRLLDRIFYFILGVAYRRRETRRPGIYHSVGRHVDGKYRLRSFRHITCHACSIGETRIGICMDRENFYLEEEEIKKGRKIICLFL